MTIWQDFMTYDGSKLVTKWSHYFPIYERHFSFYKNKSLFFLEIGVASGGSLGMWQRYFGPFAKVVGIDIEPSCKQHEAPGIAVRIGDQSNPAFLQSLIDEFGVPDVVLDDGSHRNDHMRASFDFFYPKMGKNGVYMVEDIHAAYWPENGGGVHNPSTFMNFAKGCSDRLNADYTRGELAPDYITRQTFGISFYDSVVCFEKGEVWKQSLRSGG